MRRSLLRIAGLGVCAVLFSLPLWAQPTEEGLLEKWEAVQAGDDKTVVFEKVREGLYNFKTERFPFDDKLKVLNVVIDDRMSGFDRGVLTGVVEAELLDLPADFLQKYSYSYSIWEQNNWLYYDKAAGEWLSSSEYYNRHQPEVVCGGGAGYFWDFFSNVPLVLLIFFLVFLFILTKRMEKKNFKVINRAQEVTEQSLLIAQKGLALNKQSNVLLKEILAALKSKKA